MERQDDRVDEIVNLRRMKKTQQRQDAAEAAKQNRVRHGRSAAEKANDKRAEERRQALLDALRRGETGE
jgi:Domain of unknown function (DUF4169)